MNQFCEMKGIKREFSVARTPQQNEVAKRKNRTLIKAGIRPKWLFDIDTLTMSMNYQPVVARNQPNDNAEFKQGVWARIVKDINAPVNDQGLISDQLIKRNVCDSRTTRLWKDFWIGDTPLQHQFPCLFRLEVNQDCMVRVRWNDGRNTYTRAG
nr:RNA-directed DNA polymerase, eukaryota [Tanacetum cinerariifolium]